MTFAVKSLAKDVNLIKEAAVRIYKSAKRSYREDICFQYSQLIILIAKLDLKD